MTDESRDSLAAQVAEESEKRAAKKAAQPKRRKTKAADLVEVVMRGAGRDAGTTRKVTPEAADRLERQGHAHRV